MGIPKWLSTVIHVAPMALAMAVPGMAPFVPYFMAGVQSAEQIPGATGEQKLAAAVNIAQAGILAAQAAGAHIDAAVTNQAIVDGVNAVVKGVNSFHGKTTKALADAA